MAKLSKKVREAKFKEASEKAWAAEQAGDTETMNKYRREMMDLISY